MYWIQYNLDHRKQYELYKGKCQNFHKYIDMYTLSFMSKTLFSSFHQYRTPAFVLAPIVFPLRYAQYSTTDTVNTWRIVCWRRVQNEHDSGSCIFQPFCACVLFPVFYSTIPSSLFSVVLFMLFKLICLLCNTLKPVE